MSDRFTGAATAGGYDRAFGHVSREFVPPLLRAARLAPGQRVLDIATGTGAAAEIAAAVVGPSGHVVAADISRPMLEKGRRASASVACRTSPLRLRTHRRSPSSTGASTRFSAR
jgi:SAM-dependent methyltransferase